MDRLADQLCSKPSLFQPADTIGDDKQLLSGIYQEAVLILPAPALMGHTRRLELTSQHLGMKGLIRRRLPGAVSGM